MSDNDAEDDSGDDGDDMTTMMKVMTDPIFADNLFPHRPSPVRPSRNQTHTENYSSKGRLVTVDGQKKYTTFPRYVIDSSSDAGMCPISARNSPRPPSPFFNVELRRQ